MIHDNVQTYVQYITESVEDKFIIFEYVTRVLLLKM